MRSGPHMKAVLAASMIAMSAGSLPLIGAEPRRARKAPLLKTFDPEKIALAEAKRARKAAKRLQQWKTETSNGN